MNKVILFGNLGHDPEVKVLESGVLVGRFSLATSENYQKDGEWKSITEWHTVVVWRTQAERAEKQLKKGDSILLEGKIQYKQYTDRDGNNRMMTQIVADFFTKAKGSSKGKESDNWPTEADAPPSRQRDVPAESNTSDSGPSSKYEDLPF